ncbi:Hypp9307, partial [Branchiostoma lanceolatum]
MERVTEDVKKELDWGKGAVGGRPGLQHQTSDDGEVERLTKDLHFMRMAEADGVGRSESSDSGYTTVSDDTSSRRSCNDEIEEEGVGQPCDQSRQAPVSFTSSSPSNNTSRPVSIAHYTVNIQGCPNQTTYVQIGSGNTQHIRNKTEKDMQMVPLQDDFVKTLVEVHHPGGEEKMVKRLQDETYVRKYVQKMKEQNVPHSIKKFGRGCIVLELEVENPADAQKLVQMCRDGSYQRILMETFLPEFLNTGQPLGISLAITVRKPDGEEAVKQTRRSTTALNTIDAERVAETDKLRLSSEHLGMATETMQPGKMLARPGSMWSPKPPPRPKWTPFVKDPDYISYEDVTQDKKGLLACSKGDDFSKPPLMAYVMGPGTGLRQPTTIKFFPQDKQDGKQPLDVAEVFNPIADEVGPYWKDLALQLQLSPAAIARIETMNGGDVTRCCLSVLQKWRSKMTHQATLPALYRALKSKAPGGAPRDKLWPLPP